MNLEVCYINLDRSVDRRRRLEACLAAAGLTAARIAAVDGAAVIADPAHGYDPKQAMRAAGRALLPGELGCYLSHLAALKRVAQAKGDWVLVLEDDARVPPDAGDRLRHLMRLLPDEVGVVNLARRPRHEQTLMDAGCGLVRAHYFPVTTTALLWRPGAAPDFLSAACPIRHPVDVQLQIWATKRNNGAALLDPLMPPDDGESVIYSGRRSDADGKTFAYRYKRLLRILNNRLNARKHRA